MEISFSLPNESRTSKRAIVLFCVNIVAAAASDDSGYKREKNEMSQTNLNGKYYQYMKAYR